MFNLQEISEFLPTKITALQMVAKDASFAYLEKTLTFYLEIFESLHTYMCEMERTCVILIQLSKKDKNTQQYIELLQQQCIAYLELNWVAGLKTPAEACESLTLICSSPNFYHLLTYMIQLKNSTPGMQEQYQNDDLRSKINYQQLLQNYPSYPPSSPTAIFQISTQVNQPIKMLGNLKAFYGKLLKNIAENDGESTILEWFIKLKAVLGPFL